MSDKTKEFTDYIKQDFNVVEDYKESKEITPKEMKKTNKDRPKIYQHTSGGGHPLIMSKDIPPKKLKEDLSFVLATIVAMDIERRPLTRSAREIIFKNIANISKALSQHEALKKRIMKLVDDYAYCNYGTGISLSTRQSEEIRLKLLQLLEEDKVWKIIGRSI